MKARRLAGFVLAGWAVLFAAVRVWAEPRTTLPILQSSNPPIIVSPSGPYTTIQAALADAQAGDTIEVRGGTYSGPLVVEKSVTLEGVASPDGPPVIDGGGQGTVVTLAAPDIVFRGFEVRGSGVEPDRDHAGLTLTASGITVENNRLRDVLFGIFVAQADNAVLRGNDITSKAEYGEGRKGDGIRVWYSADVTVERNHVHEARDVVIWYSANVIVRENVIERGRYGIHLMYGDGAQIERNQVRNNSVGLYTMYSNGVTLSENDIRGQRGPSGYGLGFKDAEDVTVTGNLVVDNRGGAFLDGTPFSPQGYARFDHNIFAFNDVGVIMLTAVRGNVFENNTFWENVEQMAVQGSGKIGMNTWQGNFWSDYTGFDADGDGWGDSPYTAERFFESLTDREPLLRALIYSPAAQTIEFAAASFPIVKPQPKLTDPTPLMQPAALTAFAVAPRNQTPGMALAGFGLLVVGLACGALVLVRGGRSMRSKTLTAESAENAERPIQELSADSALSAVNYPAVRVEHVSKRYGKVAALNGVTFEAQAGEALALWGVNGAGKTTLIKAILGLIDFEGHIAVEGHDARRAGKAARRSIGYVPQEAVFYDQSVQATMEFYARLKGGTEIGGLEIREFSNLQSSNPQSPIHRIPLLLDQLGLAEHARKPVSALSGGLKQRLALAVALLADPPVLLLDEPTANLDAKARRDYLTLLTALRKDSRKTILFASHRLEEVETLASRVLVMEAGQVIEVLLPGDIHRRLAPDVELTLWVPEDQRPRALACLEDQGLKAHLNGRGTVVVQVSTEKKLQPLTLLAESGITVLDFEMERGRLWN